MERRSHPRVEVSHSVVYFTEFYPRLPKPKVASTLDLSQGGTKIESPDSLPKNSRLQIIIAIPPKAIRCKAKVIYVSELENDKVEAGIQFEELSIRDKLYLNRYLSRLMTQRDKGINTSA